MAIDLPAGPSEVAVLADTDADPAFIALDLLSQAEHGPDSQVLLITWAEDLIPEVTRQVNKILPTLPRHQTASAALKHSKMIRVKDWQTGVMLINDYAPEHLIINAKQADLIAEKILNAGSVFIGPMTPESAGDYASGTNHTLPTNGYARNHSGITLYSFMKQISFQKITDSGLKHIGWAIEAMAEAEQLDAHKQAVSVRLAKNKGADIR